MKLDRLREWREYRGFTQEELAERAGIARYSISNYEVGKTSARRATAERIAEGLGVSLEDLATPPIRPKVLASLLNLDFEQRRDLVSMLAGREYPPMTGELERFAEIRRAAIKGGMSFEEFNEWYGTASAETVRPRLLPEDVPTLEEEVRKTKV